MGASLKCIVFQNLEDTFRSSSIMATQYRKPSGAFKSHETRSNRPLIQQKQMRSLHHFSFHLKRILEWMNRARDHFHNATALFFVGKGGECGGTLGRSEKIEESM